MHLIFSHCFVRFSVTTQFIIVLLFHFPLHIQDSILVEIQRYIMPIGFYVLQNKLTDEIILLIVLLLFLIQKGIIIECVRTEGVVCFRL